MTNPTEQLPATAAAHLPTVTDSGALVSRYHRDGYVVLGRALRSDEVRALREEAVRICRGERGAVDGVQPLAADEPDQLVIRRSPPPARGAGPRPPPAPWRLISPTSS